MRSPKTATPRLKTRRVTHMRLVWRGITIRIRYTWKYWDHHGQRNGDTTDHLEVRIARNDAPFWPLSNTEYRSYFVQTKQLRDAGGAQAFVAADLVRNAADPQWIKASSKARQLDLFAP
jgi:hypothetical protein